MKLGTLIKIFLLSQLLCSAAFAIDDLTVKRQLLENFNYLMLAQAKCDGDFGAGHYICNPDTPGSRRILGTWDSAIIPVAFKGTYPMRFRDSNMFVTAHTLYPLFLLQFDDPELERQRKNAIGQAIQAINKFQRGDAFAFWPQIGPSIAGQVNRIGPLNLSPLLLSSQVQIIESVQSFLHLSIFPKKVQWMQENVDLKNRQTGMDVFFNVPDDADDTALGIVSNYMNGAENPEQVELGETPAILPMTRQFDHYVDSFEARKRRRYKSYVPECKTWMTSQHTVADQENLYKDKAFLQKCSLDDPRESWRGLFPDKYSDSYLTWFYNEKDPIYAHPEQGVALPGQNSVDCNVLANVLYTLALTGQNKARDIRPRYLKTCDVISDLIVDDNNEIRRSLSPRTIDQGQMISTWKVCGLFYPARMTFPYLMSKAVAANACQDLNPEKQARFDLAINLLTKDIASDQDSVTPQKKSGEWYEKIDNTIGLPSALGAASLLNIKMTYKEKLSFSDQEIQKRAAQGIEAVLRWSRQRTSQGTPVAAASLQEGTFFGGGTVNEIAHWRSEPFATAVSLELMTKYLMFTQEHSGSLTDKRMLIEKSQSGVPENFIFHTKNLETYPLTKEIDSGPIRQTVVNAKDHLTPLAVHNGQLSGNLGVGVSGQGAEAIIGIELIAGKVIQGSQQENHEQVAYYKVKVNGDVAINIADGGIDEANIQVKFLGVMTKSDFIINDEISYMSVQYFKEADWKSEDLYLADGELNVPVFQINDKIHFNLALIGKLIGFAREHAQDGQENLNRNSENLGDFTMRMGLVAGPLSAQVGVESAMGLSQSSGTVLHPAEGHVYKLGGKISFQLSRNQQINLVATENEMGSIKDNRVVLSYQYHIQSH